MSRHALVIATVLIVFAVLSRFVPHPVNFAPIGALGLYAGVFFIDRRYWLIPLAALLISDVFIGFYDWISMLFVYMGFACSAFIGRLLIKQLKLFNISAAAFVSATVFFVLSNFGTWLSGTLYPLTGEGLIACFIAAIPFYGNTLAGDLFYTAVLFGLHIFSVKLLSKKPVLNS